MGDFKITSANTIEVQITNFGSKETFIIDFDQQKIALRKKNHSRLAVMGLEEGGVRGHGLGMFEEVRIYP